MATAKKKVVKKKSVTKKAATKSTPKKATTKKKPVRDTKIKVTHEQYHKMVCEAAYYISLEKTAETINPTEDWLQAEAAINRICVIAD